MRNFDQSNTLPELFSNISVFFIAFLLQLILFVLSLRGRSCQVTNWMMKADNWPVDGRQHGGMAYIIWNYDNLSTKWCIKHLPLLNLNNARDLFPRVSYQLSSSSWYKTFSPVDILQGKIPRLYRKFTNFWILKIATDLHSNYFYSKKLKHFYYFERIIELS
jgi:hypothetical protein